MRELDISVNMRTAILKLPYKLREKWRASACEILERINHRAQFIDIVTFVEHQAKIVSDPIFGDIQNSQLATVSKNANGTRSQSKPRFKGDSFATTVATIETLAPEESRKSNQVQRQGVSSTKNTSVCVLFSKSPTRAMFTIRGRKKHRDKINFLKEKGICFACLCIGHRSKDCDKHLTYKVCSQKHPSILHINQPKEPSVSSALVSLQT